MKTETEKAIKAVLRAAEMCDTPDHAMKYTQSALNLAHVLSILDSLTEETEFLHDQLTAQQKADILFMLNQDEPNEDQA